jgi:hypothetical protein
LAAVVIAPELKVRKTMPINCTSVTISTSGATNDGSYTRYLLGQFRLAQIRVRMIDIALDTAHTALKASWIDPVETLEFLNNEAPEALEFLAPSPPPSMTWCSS